MQLRSLPPDAPVMHTNRTLNLPLRGRKAAQAISQSAQNSSLPDLVMGEYQLHTRMTGQGENLTRRASELAPAQISFREAKKAAVCPGCPRLPRMPSPWMVARAGSASSGSSTGATPALRSMAANSAGALQAI